MQKFMLLGKDWEKNLMRLPSERHLFTGIFQHVNSYIGGSGLGGACSPLSVPILPFSFTIYLLKRLHRSWAPLL